MARINIDEQFWIDIGRVERGSVSYNEIVGSALRLFRFAQDRYKNGKAVSHEDWIQEGFYDCLVPIFAEKCDDGYFVRGSEKQFGWLKERKEAARLGGIASGIARQQGKVPSSDSNKLTEANPTKPNPLPLPLSQEKFNNSSSSKSLSYEECARRVLEGTRKFGPDFWDDLQEFWGPEISAMVKAAGGTGKFRTLKNDQWLLTNVTKMLAATKL